MIQNIIGGIIIFLGLSLFVLGNILFNYNCNKFTESKETKKIKNLNFEVLIQREKICYISGFFMIIIGILVIIFA